MSRAALLVLAVLVPGSAAGASSPAVLVVSAGSDIVVIREDGTGARALTRGPASDYFPVWSPDGALIVFVSNRDGDDELNVVRADGTRLRQLTRNRAVDTTPAWSPDGKSIVFASNQGGGEHKLYVMPAAGGSARLLVRGPRTAFDIAPSWSPDGKLIAFASNRAGYENSDIWVIRPDGRGLRRLTRTPFEEGTPSWSPDGRSIAFSTNRDRQQEIYVTRADGSGARRLTRRPRTDDILPRWSPDGQTISYTSTPFPQGKPNVYLVPAAGGVSRRLTSGGDASWRP